MHQIPIENSRQEVKAGRQRTERMSSISRKRSWPWKFLLIINLLSLAVLTSCIPEEVMEITDSSVKNLTSSEPSVKESTSALVHRHQNHNKDHHHQRRHQQQKRNDGEHEEGVTNDHPTEENEPDNHSASSAPALFEGDTDVFPFGYWIRVAQAKAMAISVENGTIPKLEVPSHIMKPGLCSKENQDKCRSIDSKCADEEAKRLHEELRENEEMDTKSKMPEYMQAIWNKCGNNYSYTQFDDNDTLFAPNNIVNPRIMFHCNSHVASTEFVSNFRMEYPGSIAPPSYIPSDVIPRYFVIEMAHQRGKWEIPSVQPYWFFRFNTKVDETYQIRVTAVSPKYIYPPVMSDPIKIYEYSKLEHIKKKTAQPLNLRANVSVDNGAARPSPSALLRWESGSGYNASCDFDVFYMDEDVYQTERKKAEESFWVKFDSLKFETNYTIKVIEKFGGNLESEALSMTLHVPSCFELRGYSFDLCRPPPPKNVRLVNATETSFWIKWDPPNYANASNRIISYNLTVHWIYTTPSVDKYNTHKIFSGGVPGNTTAIEIKNKSHPSSQFRVLVTAISSSGPSASSWDVFYLNGPSYNAWTVRKMLILFFALFGVIGLVGFFCLIKNFHERRQRRKERQEKFENYEKEDLQLPQIDRDAAKWEIDYCNLSLGDQIGEGYFGLVRRGVLSQRGRKLTVAVKTLRDDVNRDPKKCLEEFEILKNLDPGHVHVVGLIGIVKSDVPLLVVEFCDGGNLQMFLRQADTKNFGRKYSPSATPSTSGGSSMARYSAEKKVQVRMVTNDAYFASNGIEQPQQELTLVDLLSFSRQIACGMEFLSTNKVVHRDLATRNILLSGRNRILKISDFGLSKDVYEQNLYKISSKGSIPVKWLAPECLLKDVYTIESDVWSYGILLWEIFTYGGCPYPGVETRKVFDLLKDGYRMDRPEHCPQDLYVLMKACWEEEPCDRPDFTSIRLILEDIIEKTTQVTYLNLETANPSSCDYTNTGHEPPLPPSRKPLPRIPFQRMDDDSI
ncbi:unnamed protein product [Orchesella dallaii]|uniref:receptor protein-tyrosine kinase n=1 Tax=Orchesella dallaii TaxID=48710 RepID=A0ABP1S506_9HEXA